MPDLIRYFLYFIHQNITIFGYYFMATNNKRTLISSALILVSTLLLVAIYYSPIWWVALTAPNYPEESFPDGVRIDFHMNGVFNGCQKVYKAELAESEALDCVHEMDTINHYVGMYPIAAGGVIKMVMTDQVAATVYCGYIVIDEYARVDFN